MSTTMARAARKGFTLVELLVVIGIIAVLISILLPALALAKEQANRTRCSNNLHQIGLSIYMFSQYNGRVPYGNSMWPTGGAWWRTWMYLPDYFQLTQEYGATDALFVCPTNAHNDTMPLVNTDVYSGTLFGDADGNLTEAQAQALCTLDNNGSPLATDPRMPPCNLGTTISGSLTDYNAVADFSYAYYGMCAWPQLSSELPFEVYHLTDHTSVGAATSRVSDDINPPLMSDVVMYQSNATGLKFKYNHGKNWSIANSSSLPAANPASPASGGYPSVTFAGTVFENVLFADGSVQGKSPDNTPWMCDTAVDYWFK